MVLYTNHSSSQSWKMPGRYYYVDIPLIQNNNTASSDEKEIEKGKEVLRVAVLDACTLVCAVDTSKSKNFRCSKKLSTDSFSSKLIQLEWLDQVLSASVNEHNDAIVWKAVLSHWPLYSVLGNGPTASLIEEVKPILEKVITFTITIVAKIIIVNINIIDCRFYLPH